MITLYQLTPSTHTHSRFQLQYRAAYSLSMTFNFILSDNHRRYGIYRIYHTTTGIIFCQKLIRKQEN